MNWPEGTRESQKEHALNHVKSADLAISLCKQKRTAVQAGGNIGLWPLRMAPHFTTVYTFEPEPVTRESLVKNLAFVDNVWVSALALGQTAGRCGISRRSLGSHTITSGDDCEVIALDSMRLHDVDLLQLDIEGYELHALIGAEQTIRTSRPVIQVELRGFTEKYGHTDADVIEFLARLGYYEAGRVPGSDVVFCGRQ